MRGSGFSPSAESARVPLPNVTLSGTILLGVLAGPRSQSLPCIGALPTDQFVITPVSALPAGYMLGDAFCATAGQITISLYTPAVTLLTNYSIPVRVAAFR